jgi:hypothetical protein
LISKRLEKKIIGKRETKFKKHHPSNAKPKIKQIVLQTIYSIIIIKI